MFAVTIGQFIERDYFQQAFGKSCPDFDRPDFGLCRQPVDDYIFRRLQKRDLWPIWENRDNFKDRDVFRLTVLLHSLVSKPIDGWFHSFNGCGMHYETFDKEAGQREFEAEVNDIFRKYGPGYELTRRGEIVTPSSVGDQSPLDVASADEPQPQSRRRFPFGLPVSRTKPDAEIKLTTTSQLARYQETSSVGVLGSEIEGDLCVAAFREWANPEFRLMDYTKPERTYQRDEVLITDRSLTMAHNLCQSPVEQSFLEEYFRKFVLAFAIPDNSGTKYVLNFNDMRGKVPALVPQTWIRWHSLSKASLSRMNYSDPDGPYRLDFAIFWRGRCFVVEIDGIEHYADKQSDGRWIASETKYAARLREDRLLRTLGWQVFRVGNWEVRNELDRSGILEELRHFVGFDEPPQIPPLSSQLDEDIPF